MPNHFIPSMEGLRTTIPRAGLRVLIMCTEFKIRTGLSPLVVTDISHPSITVSNADGVTDEGLSYLDLMPFVSDGALDPGEILGPITLRFHNPNMLRFTFDLRVEAVC